VGRQIGKIIVLLSLSDDDDFERSPSDRELAEELAGRIRAIVSEARYDGIAGMGADLEI
jgi:hypothetical protein